MDVGAVDAGPTDASGDAGTDASMMDAGDDAGFVDPCTTLEGDIVYCESFETERDYSADLQLDPGASYERSSAEFRGADGHSGHFAVPSGTTYASLTLARRFSALAGGSRWVRSWQMLPSGPLDLTFFVMQSSRMPDVAIGVYTQGTAYTSMDALGFEPEPPGVTTLENVAQGEWFCVEMNVDHDANTVELFFNGVSAAVIAAPIPESIDSANFGSSYRDPDAPEDYDIYVDDIVMSRERIGCD